MEAKQKRYIVIEVTSTAGMYRRILRGFMTAIEDDRSVVPTAISNMVEVSTNVEVIA